MPPDARETLALAPGGGWLRGGRAWRPDGDFYAVTGDPVAHSLSPVLQGAALAARGLPYAYLALRVPGGDLARLKGAPWAGALRGFNVTAPLKEEALALCDAVTPLARRAGAVNTVRVGVDGWEGHNTDVDGIRAALADAWPDAAPPRAGIVLGTGGSARAAVLALLAWGAGRVSVRARGPDSGRRFRAWLDGCGAPGAAAVAVEPLLGTAGPCPGESAAWVVCLAAGVPAAPALPPAAPPGRSLLLDLRYGVARPAETAPPGFAVRDGREALLRQGGLAFGWWFGEPVPWALMRAALAAVA